MVAAVVQRMSPEVVAALLGVLVGILGDRLTRYMGRLWNETSDWSITYFGRPDERGEPQAIGGPPTPDTIGLAYSFSLDMFNGREIPTGLRDIAVVLVCEGGVLVSEPEDVATEREIKQGGIGFFGYRYDKVRVINLPPREWIHKDLQGQFRTEGGVRAATWQKAILVGKWPSRLRREFRKEIAVRERTTQPPWWRRIFG